MIIWEQPLKEPDKEIEQIIEEAELAIELAETIEREQAKSPFRGFAK